MTARCALYYAPEDGSPLEALGRRWLGRDVRTGEPSGQEEVPGLSAGRLAALTDDPRRYGFHGTLKPPFALAEGFDRSALVGAVEDFAAGCRAFLAPPLRLVILDGFLALVPSGPSDALEALAAGCVQRFERFRAPPSALELARRRSNGLTPRQERNLKDWGYPYVLEDFRFHLTLTARIHDEADHRAIRAVLDDLAAQVCREPMPVASICLFEQPRADAPFRLTRRFPFG